MEKLYIYNDFNYISLELLKLIGKTTSWIFTNGVTHPPQTSQSLVAVHFTETFNKCLALHGGAGSLHADLQYICRVSNGTGYSASNHTTAHIDKHVLLLRLCNPTLE